MLIPFPRTYSIQGQLAAADGTQPWVMVYAHPSQCAKLSLDESAVVVADAPGQLDVRSEAQITRLAPHEDEFEAPPPAPHLRCRAAASFFLWATEEELLATRAELARETEPRVLEAALEALSRNPSSRVAALLLAPHGRTPAAAGAPGEPP